MALLMKEQLGMSHRPTATSPLEDVSALEVPTAGRRGGFEGEVLKGATAVRERWAALMSLKLDLLVRCWGNQSTNGVGERALAPSADGDDATKEIVLEMAEVVESLQMPAVWWWRMERKWWFAWCSFSSGLRVES